MPHPLLERVIQGEQLRTEDLVVVFDGMLHEQSNPAEVAAFLTAWRCFPEYKAQLVGGATVLRKNLAALNISPKRRPLFDNCGTGGSGRAKFNTSTAAAIVAATCGLNMAKHGNRSASGRCGSADFLECFGFPLQLKTEQVLTLLEQTGFTFFFAPNYHPLLKHVATVRKSLGVRTIFNLLGPLANPIAPDGQLLGVPRKSLLKPMAEAISELGTKRALIVHAQSGLDEICSEARTDAILVNHGALEELSIDPVTYGLFAKEQGLLVGDPKECRSIFEAILDGDLRPERNAVVLNASYLLWLGSVTSTVSEAIELTSTRIDDGSVKKFFHKWLQLAKAMT